MNELIDSTNLRQKHSGNLMAIGKIVCFFAILVLLCYVLDFVINSGLRRIKTSTFGVWNEIINGQVNADILITGSSRAHSHYDPRIIQSLTGRKAYNIGLNGSQTDMQLARLKTYLKHNTKPTLIIHNLDLFSFQVTHGGVYEPGQYLPYLKDLALYNALLHINKDQWKAKLLPLYGYAVEDLRFTWLLGVAGFLNWNPKEDHFFGFRPKHTAWTGDFEHFKETHPNGVRFDVEPDGVKAMEDLLSLCRQQGIPVLLVYSPEYNEMQAITSNRAEVFTRFDGLSKRFDMPVWDFSGSSISTSRANFYNSQHLNAEGAAVFSMELAKSIVLDQRLNNLLARK